MAAKKKVRDYCEPWESTKDQTWETAYRFPPTLSEHIDQDKVNAWLVAKDKASAGAHWYIWGSRMTETGVVIQTDGRFNIFNGKGILAFTRNGGALPDVPSQEALCQRVCECVNAMQAIADPVRLIEDVRGLIFDLAQGNTSPDDPRITSILGRMIPAEQIPALQEQE